MNTEETMVLGAQENENENYNPQYDDITEEVEPTNKGVNPAVIGAAAVGAAVVGVAGGYAANRIMNSGEEVPAEELAATTEETPAEDHHSEEAEVAPAPREVIRTEYITTTDHHIVHEQPIIQVIDIKSETAEGSGTDNDGDVEVLGVRLVEGEDGTYSIWAAVESSDGDRAILVDANADGTVNYFVHDDNGDGQISEGEIRDVTSDGYSMAAIVENTPEDRIYYASYDDDDSNSNLYNTANTDGSDNDQYVLAAKGAELENQDYNNNALGGEELGSNEPEVQVDGTVAEADVVVDGMPDPYAVNTDDSVIAEPDVEVIGQPEVEAGDYAYAEPADVEPVVEVTPEPVVEPVYEPEPDPVYEPTPEPEPVYEPEPEPEPTYEAESVDYGCNDAAEDYSSCDAGDDGAWA